LQKPLIMHIFILINMIVTMMYMDPTLVTLVQIEWIGISTIMVIILIKILLKIWPSWHGLHNHRQWKKSMMKSSNPSLRVRIMNHVKNWFTLMKHNHLSLIFNLRRINQVWNRLRIVIFDIWVMIYISLLISCKMIIDKFQWLQLNKVVKLFKSLHPLSIKIMGHQ